MLQVLEKKNSKVKLLNSPADSENWNEWRWHLANRITGVEELSEYTELTPQRVWEINEVAKRFRFAITPYYASLMDGEDENCPIRLQAIPRIEELDLTGVDDPLAEEKTSPVKAIINLSCYLCYTGISRLKL